jgi:alcohol dehydrogenase class IV
MSYPFIMPEVSHVGIGALNNLEGELKRLNVERVLVICDPGIVKAGVVESVLKILEKGSISYEVFSEVELEPSTDNVEQAVAILSKKKFDALIGVGGGSSLDITKGTSILATNGGRIEDYMGIELVPKPGLPMVFIPTTAGTGSEVTINAIYAIKREQVKKGVVSRFLRAAVAIVDPELTLSCPSKVTAATGMDALVHAIESYTAVKSTIQTDIYAIKAVQLIGRSLRKAVSLGSDLSARNEMAWGSFLAGVSLANAGVGAVHALAYPLGGRFHISHGVSNALLLPYVLGFNVIGEVEKFKEIAIAFGEPVAEKSPREAALSVIDAVSALSQDIGIPQRLSEFGVTEKDITELTEGAMGQTRLLTNNPRAMTKEDIYRIYRQAL